MSFVFLYGIRAVNDIIVFFENADESADGMLRCIRKTMDNSQIDWERMSCFSTDSCKFGIKHSLYPSIPTLNVSAIKANLNAHILHNSVKCALQDIDEAVENIIQRIYRHPSLSKKRTESLNEFHLFVETEYI